MAPSIDGLGGAKPGDNFVLHEKGARTVEDKIKSLDWSSPFTDTIKIREGSIVTVADRPASWKDCVYLDIPRGNIFAPARKAFSTNEDLFSGRAPDKEVPSRRER